MIIIGIAGKKGAGKDECYKAALAYYISKGKTVERIAFADSLKQEVAVACMVSIPYIEAHKENFRRILQGWGTDFRRRLMGDNYWIQRWLNKVSASKADVIIAPDTRFFNELIAIQSMKGQVWQVVRPSLSDNDSHPSETELDNFEKFDCIIINGYSKLILHRDVQLNLGMHEYTK